MEHITEIRVRYPECDPMGYVHHANYLVYFEIGRTELLRHLGGSYREVEASGILAVVVKAEVKYHSPARYDDLLKITTRVTRVTAARMVHEYEITREHLRIASATVTLALVDSSGQIQRVPEWMRIPE